MYCYWKDQKWKLKFNIVISPPRAFFV
jgi:hypothetical protein